MTQTQLKQQVARAAIEYLRPHLYLDTVIGVGTGSTARCFVEQLALIKNCFSGAVASSKETEAYLKQYDIPLHDLNYIGELPFYIDGADEATEHLHLIKGGGAALTREKIVAAASKIFICIIDESKYVEKLGAFPLPVEVIPMARSYVARKLVKLGGSPEYRQDTVTDNGNVILDVWHLDIVDPVGLESAINQIAGVVTNGLFARRSADQLLIGKTTDVITMSIK